jgi:YVTN family beta-propeller protein
MTPVPEGVAITSDGNKGYVAIARGGVVVVIDTARNTAIASIPVSSPFGVAVTPDGSRVYVTGSGAVSVIDTTSNTVVATIPVGGENQSDAVERAQPHRVEPPGWL